MDKENSIYMGNGILLFSLNEKEILPFTTWMNLVGIILNELRQIQKEKYFIVFIICGI